MAWEPATSADASASRRWDASTASRRACSARKRSLMSRTKATMYSWPSLATCSATMVTGNIRPSRARWRESKVNAPRFETLSQWAAHLSPE